MAMMMPVTNFVCSSWSALVAPNVGVQTSETSLVIVDRPVAVDTSESEAPLVFVAQAKRVDPAAKASS